MMASFVKGLTDPDLWYEVGHGVVVIGAISAGVGILVAFGFLLNLAAKRMKEKKG